MPGTVSFDNLENADLTVEAVYLGGAQKNVGDDPLARLLPVGNQGGFRYKGSPVKKSVRLVVLYTSGAEIDWPDNLDPQTGIFTYYGDNREPGRGLHDTARDGNLLRETPSRLRTAPPPTAHRCRRSSFLRGQRRAAPCGSEACSPQELKHSQPTMISTRYGAASTVSDFRTTERSSAYSMPRTFLDSGSTIWQPGYRRSNRTIAQTPGANG